MRYQRVLVPSLLGWYLILILGHYFHQRPLWNDEQCVLNSILQLKSSALFTRSLLNDQAFPRLYLWFIQQFSSLFNQSLLALRFFSLVAMMGAFFVWLKVARRILDQSWDFLLFIGCWGASIPLVYYAAELKPYSMDVLISGIMVLFLIDQNEIRKNAKIYWVILFFLPFLACWSYPVIFLLILPLYNLIRDCVEEGCWLPELSFFLTGLILTLGFLFLFDFRVSRPHLMSVYWHDYFISLDSMKGFLNTFGKGMNNLISRRFAESPRWVKVPSRIFIGIGLGYMFLTFWHQFKKDRFTLRSVVPITFAMFLIQFVLAIGGIFPFAVPRLSLFFSPLLYLMTIGGIDSIRKRNKVLGIILQVFLIGYLIFISLGIAWDIFIQGILGAEATLYSGIF